MSDYWLVAHLTVGGKSGRLREGQLLTATRGNSRESATETKPPIILVGKDEKSGVRAHN